MISESPTDPERMRLIETVTKDAAGFLGVDLVADAPAHIVETVNSSIVQIVFGEQSRIPEDEEKHLLLGCLWGAQMVRELEWSWADLRRDGVLDVAVVSPEKDMTIYPFTFVADCIAKRCICTVALSFNMLIKRKGEVIFDPGSYENVMTHIRHIVPPYVLETNA